MLDGERLSIGRADGCGVALPWDPEVSRLHAVVERIDGVWIVEDAGSRNGTAVDDERVSGPRLLQDGAVIRAGRTQILFHCTAPGDASRTEAAVAIPAPDAHRRPAPRAGGAVPPVAVGRVRRPGEQPRDRRTPSWSPRRR